MFFVHLANISINFCTRLVLQLNNSQEQMKFGLRTVLTVSGIELNLNRKCPTCCARKSVYIQISYKIFYQLFIDRKTIRNTKIYKQMPHWHLEMRKFLKIAMSPPYMYCNYQSVKYCMVSNFIRPTVRAWVSSKNQHCSQS